VSGGRPGPRQATNKLLEAIDEGFVCKDYVIEAALNWLSDADVHQMCLANDILLEDDDEN
jgi:hypothetical protein